MGIQNAEKVFDNQAALKLLDPKKAGIPLVPLTEVEQHQSTFFWAAVFFGIFCVTVGALASLLTTTYNNPPVILLLGLFLASYLIFFVVFSGRGFAGWRRLRKASVGSGTWSRESIGERVATLERRLQLLKVHRDLGQYVFDGVHILSCDEFNQRVEGLLPFEPDDPRRKKFNQRLISEGIISVDKSDSENWTVTYETDFDAAL
ncbi:hypothetical protein ACFL4K_01550 [Candidatus Neomarinimicrobiota bacterium]